MTKTEAVRKQFQRAIARLKEALAEENTEFVRDACIQRFEFCFDLSWKFLKTLLIEEKGIQCQGPKDCFRVAYKQGLLDYDDYWLEMTNMRNLTSHTYKEDLAKEVYSKLPQALAHFEKLMKA